MKIIVQASVLVAFFAYQTSIAQTKSLTDEQYFKGNFKGITQPLPVVTSWKGNSHFLLMRDGKTVLVDAATGKETEATAETKVVDVRPIVMVRKNDIYISIDGKEQQLTSDSAKEANPVLSPDGKLVAFTKNNDLYTIDLGTKKENRITFDGSETILNGYASWVYMEEILGRASAYRAFWWSPDSRNIAFFRSDDSQVPVFTITDANTQRGYVEKVRYPKVGDKNPEVRIGISSANGGKIVWADFNAKDDQYFGMPYWKPDGSGLLVQWMNRKQNELQIWNVNPSTGSKQSFYTEQQKTFINLDDDDRITFLDNGRGLLLMSDKSGWKQIYYHDMNGKLVNAVTSGKYTVQEINHIDTKNDIVYFTAKGIGNSAYRDLYRVNLNGKNLKRLTFGDYYHTNINMSPDASYFVTSYSNASTPPAIALLSNSGKLVKQFGSAKAADFDQYRLAKTSVVRVKSDDGLFELPMKITWPVDIDKSKKYPVLISVYGGPNAGTVTDTWTLSGNQQWYAKEGLIQVAMDHRGSGHFGKAGVDYLHHKLGYWEMKDYSTMVKWLVDSANADPRKICITGFSYGGFVTAYALTYGSDVFTHGMAGGSVTDWSLYDSHYTERFMGTKEDNAEGYKNSNVMNYVDSYKGMLQIVHGVIDENVHMQNSLQLVSALQDKQKDFEFMLYSGGRHGWGGAKGIHFANLKTKFIYRYLLEKEMPKGLLK